MDGLATPALAAIFLAAAAATWLAGVRLSDATDIVDDRFNLGSALGGMVLLGIAGTLPELAITVSAAFAGHLELAVGNLLGGIAMQTMVLVLLDGVSRRRHPLSTLSDHLEPLLEAVMVVVAVVLALMGSLLGDGITIGPVSPLSIAIVVSWVVGMLVLNTMRTSQRWQAAEVQLAEITEKHHHITLVRRHAGPPAGNRYTNTTTKAVITAFALLSGVTLVAGVFLEQTGNAIADRFDINGAVFGATVLAAVTALPEVSTGIRAVKLGNVGLAMGDIFGGNAVQMTLFLVADLIAGKPALASADANALWLGATGVVVTAIFVGGLIVRPARKRAGLGPDSWLVLVTYVLAVAALPFLAK